MLVLKESDVLGLLSNVSVPECRHLLERLHDVLREYTQTKSAPPAERTIHQPEREVIVSKVGTTTLFMPSSITTSTGVKVVTIGPRGLKGAITLFAPEGELLGLVNAEEVTAFRTALAVMIPLVRYARRAKTTNMVVLGAGRQAEWHVKLGLLLGGVQHVTVVNRSEPRRMEQLFGEMRDKWPAATCQLLLKTAPDYDQRLRECLAVADVVCCCTPATTPHFPASYLNQSPRPRFISLIGSYKPAMREIDSETLLSGAGGRIFVDTKEGCLAEAGELIEAHVTEDQLVEIGELLDDSPLPLEGHGQGHGQGNVVFKCVGLGIMDIVMAGELLGMAKEKGAGVTVDDF